MLDNINENKLLFLDIETAGTYATLEDMEQNNKTLFQLWDNTGDSYFRRHYVEDARLSSSELFKNMVHYYQSSEELFVLVLVF